MKSNIFIPKKINVGFQERSGTYTGKLGYVIYYDEKGALRKEGSWNSWRDKSINNEEFDNEPTSGFVLNKKVGDYVSNWNHRQSYVRVYDSRQFEFEITIPNLLYILENTNSIKGKGLEGEFVYAWDKTDLILMPVDSPDYKEISTYNEQMHSRVKLKGKDMKLGGTYLTKDNAQIVYLGRFDEWESNYIYEDYEDSYYGTRRRYTGKKEYVTKRKSYFFADPEGGSISTIQSLTKNLIAVISEDCVDNYVDLVDKLECSSLYSPVDDTKDEYIVYTFEEFTERAKKAWWEISFYTDETINEKKIKFNSREDYTQGMYEEYDGVEHRTDSWGKSSPRTVTLKKHYDSLEKVFELYKPKYLRKYLENGKLYSEDK